MRDGWYFIPVFAPLVFFMLEEQQEAMAPFYATAHPARRSIRRCRSTA